MPGQIPMARFGISTHLYHDQRLSREHLVEIAEHGFGAIELFATRTHFDYHDGAAIGRLREWLRDTGLTLHSIHAPVTESFVAGRWGPAFSTAAADAAERQRTVREVAAALEVVRQIPAAFMVLHLGVPRGQKSGPGDNNRDAARRSLEEIDGLAGQMGVRVAVEVIPNELSTPASLVRLLEEEIELPRVGICLDFGHAFLLGDMLDGIELISGHLLTTHVHDNHGREDDHLVPYDGAIDWSQTLTMVQKVGYEGTFLMEVGNSSTPVAVLEKVRRAGKQFERTLAC
jgi:sugar phosphate isomerase/epimerase